MSRKSLSIAVALFVLASVLTLFMYATASHLKNYWLWLCSLGIASGVLGMAVLSLSGWRWKPMLLVTVGLIVGQWWLIEFMIVQVMWHAAGFAP
jgi:hypothetical protein